MRGGSGARRRAPSCHAGPIAALTARRASGTSSRGGLTGLARTHTECLVRSPVASAFVATEREPRTVRQLGRGASMNQTDCVDSGEVAPRESFDRVPDIYHCIRPGYPAALFDDL